MPPKKEEGPHPTIVKAARNTIGNVNNAIFKMSLQDLKKTATIKTIVNAYTKTLKRNLNEKASAFAAEEAKTGGIDLRKIFNTYVDEWAAIPYATTKDLRTKQTHTKLSSKHIKLIDDINDILEGVTGLSISRIETNTPYYYAERAIARDIMRGDYDAKLDELRYVVEKDGPNIIAADHGLNLLSMISSRQYKLNPGGGAGTAGGARRRRTHKRKTHRRKTHKRRH